VPPAVDHEARRSDDIHPLVDQRLARQPARRKQQVSEQDERGPDPAGDFDGELGAGQAASLLST